MDAELKCDVWFTRSAGFVGMKQGAVVFWINVHSWLHGQKHFAPYNLQLIHDHNVKSKENPWHTISSSAMKYYGEITRVERRWPSSASITEIVTLQFGQFINSLKFQLDNHHVA